MGVGCTPGVWELPGPICPVDRSILVPLGVALMQAHGTEQGAGEAEALSLSWWLWAAPLFGLSGKVPEEIFAPLTLFVFCLGTGGALYARKEAKLLASPGLGACGPAPPPVFLRLPKG